VFIGSPPGVFGANREAAVVASDRVVAHSERALGRRVAAELPATPLETAGSVRLARNYLPRTQVRLASRLQTRILG
jgi:hypothetical protein